jgi:DNA uptake protein ComE-like DNA-binding protein
MIDVQLSESLRTQRGVRERNEGIDSPELYQAIFEKHEISKEKFLLSYDYYKEHPGEMELVYEAVLDSLSRLEAEIKQAYTASQNAKRDSIETAKRKNFEKMRGLESRE